MEQIFVSIRDALSNAVPNEIIDEAVVLAAWGASVGGGLSDRTRAISFSHKRLSIAVQDEVWRRHLEDMAPTFVAALNAKLGEGKVKYIEFRIEPQSFGHSDGISTIPDVDVSSVPQRVREAALSISNESLRKRFLEAAAPVSKD